MPRTAVPRASIEPTILRLQLALSISRREAEACVHAGFATAGEVAAADDVEFHGAVGLEVEERLRVLASARAPGSKQPGAGKAPQLLRDRRPTDTMAKVTRPVRDTVAKLAGSGEPSAEPSRGSKRAPPHETDEKRRARRAAANALESDLDDALLKGG